jgi:hypothetical protein
VNPLIQCKTTILPLLILLACVALLPNVQAVSPPPDGGYPGGNTAEGQAALLSLTTGGFNTAVGHLSLRSNSTGGFNTAIGAGTLLANTAAENTATGAGALLSNTVGADNTGNGAFALFSNTEGSFNTAIGDQALFSNTTGINNTAIGVGALFSNTTIGMNSGRDNTANGYQALYNNTFGRQNTATGGAALLNNTVGDFNTADGCQALYHNETGSFNTAIGVVAGANITGDRNICIGAGISGVGGENNTTRIGNIYDSFANGRVVYVDPGNKLGTLSSSRRYKDEIRLMAKASEAILSLRPVSFRYKKQIDPTRSLSFGLIAEEVAQVDPDLVTPDRDGKPETVRYEAINAMLLNEFLKEHRTVQELKAGLAQQQKDFQATVARQQKQIETLTAGLQKVSAQLASASPSLVDLK